ncbi:hypothetical protein [Chroococcidiopsis sp. TS-821]|uniref:hypothetical protein n=1 Tax=Chroococcidiopsis sp. TS-821 TaxID=1378066 RepID=UPI000D4A6895|nr:hypothetical protein [Chroococcidiopsis sp. TS-821]PPS43371.1 hypothetical protein B1A85_11795 [Chroococcidiopsis sp. TS-821]
MKNSMSSFERERLEFLYHQPTVEAKTDYLAPLKSIWQRFINYLNTQNELQVWQSSDRYGNTWWNACDPRTGRTAKRSSEAEMRAWIEQQYYQ